MTTRPTLLVVAVVAATILIGCGPELPEPESPGAVLYRAEEAVELPADGALNVTVEPGQVGG